MVVSALVTAFTTNHTHDTHSERRLLLLAWENEEEDCRTTRRMHSF
jgi:hypothetical protein